MDLLGIGAVGLVAIEWLALGWLSGIDWPAEMSAFWAPRWAMRLLTGSVLVALAQLILASIGVGFGTIPLVLAVAAIGAIGLRVICGRTGRPQKPLPMENRERLGWLLLGGILLAAS